jgi:maltose O-acetyltransferase
LKKLWLLIYYGIAWHLPAQPVPGWRFAYAFRRFLVKRIFQSCGEGVIVRRHVDFGRGETLQVGNRVNFGDNAWIGPEVIFEDDVLIGAQCAIVTTGRNYEDPNVPINEQGSAKIRPVRIERDVQLGLRCIVLPGVTIGEGSVIGAGCILRTNIQPFSIAAADTPRVFMKRGGAQKKAASQAEP